MCTAISENGDYHLFGRTLDIECTYGEMVIITPRNFCIDFIHEKSLPGHFAIMGVACVRDNNPLYYDAINEAGLAMAALNFPQNAVYHSAKANTHHVASFELIPWILSQCETVSSALKLLSSTNITPDSFSNGLAATPLHWIISDKKQSVTVESVSDGLKIYENQFGVLTNNPPFTYHVTNAANFIHLDSGVSKNNLCPSINLKPYSRGMSAIGLPGDFSSPSRFVRAVFMKNHTTGGKSEEEAVKRFFHIMDTVTVPFGCVKTEEGKGVRTVYTSCANVGTFTYYFTTYNCRRIKAVRVDSARLDSDELIKFSISDKEDILYL